MSFVFFLMDNKIKISKKKNDAKFEKLLCWLYSMVLPMHGITRCMVLPVLALQHGVSGPVLVTDGHTVQFAIIT